MAAQAAAAPNLGKLGISKIKPWNGKDDYFDRFYNLLAIMFTTVPGMTETQKISTTILHLEDKAYAWVHLLVKEVRNGRKTFLAPMIQDPNNAAAQIPDYTQGLWRSWQELMDYLKSRTTLDPNEGRNAIFAAMKIKEANYKDQDFLSFLAAHREKTDLMGNISDDVKVALLKASINNHTHEEVSRRPGFVNWTYDQLMNNLMEMFREKKSVGYTHRLIQGKREPDVIPMDVDARKHGKHRHHSSKKKKSKRTWNQRSARTTQGRKDKRKSSKRRHSRKAVTVERDACFHCGQVGHFRADCPDYKRKGKKVSRKVRFMGSTTEDETSDSATGMESTTSESSSSDSEEEYSGSDSSSDEDFRMATSSRQ